MKCRVLLFFFGLAAQLDGYVLLQANQSDVDVDDIIHKRETRGAGQSSEAPAKDSSQPKEIETVHSRKHLRHDAFSPAADNKVLAFSLDTGAPVESKNGIIQAISEAFGGILERPHVRSRGKSYKASDENPRKPIALEVKSESILNSLEKFLSSPRIRKIANDLARKAAVIYRAIEKEL